MDFDILIVRHANMPPYHCKHSRAVCFLARWFAIALFLVTYILSGRIGGTDMETTLIMNAAPLVSLSLSASTYHPTTAVGCSHLREAQLLRSPSL